VNLWHTTVCGFVDCESVTWTGVRLFRLSDQNTESIKRLHVSFWGLLHLQCFDGACTFPEGLKSPLSHTRDFLIQNAQKSVGLPVQKVCPPLISKEGSVSCLMHCLDCATHMAILVEKKRRSPYKRHSLAVLSKEPGCDAGTVELDHSDANPSKERLSLTFERHQLPQLPVFECNDGAVAVLRRDCKVLGVGRPGERSQCVGDTCPRNRKLR
jgi:hypothetical protein